MKEIKFRAWDTTDNTMYRNIQNGNVFADFLHSGTFEIMQFTGLKDKNSKEIYEGDVIRNEHDEFKDYSVLWSAKVGAWILNGHNCSNSYNDILTKFSPSEFWEIIGNIYSNPELLK